MKLDREICCCFTGHRFLPAGEVAEICGRLREEIENMAGQGKTIFLAGGALGFDTLAAQEVLRLREEGIPDLHLVLVLPCLGQETKWNRRDQEIYHQLIRRADEVIYTGDLYDNGCMFRRNRYLVDHSTACICCYSGQSRGGTAYTVKYARKQGLNVVNLFSPAPSEEEPQLSLYMGA